MQKLEAHPLGWFFKISQASGSRIPRLLACWALAVSIGSERMASRWVSVIEEENMHATSHHAVFPVSGALMGIAHFVQWVVFSCPI